MGIFKSLIKEGVQGCNGRKDSSKQCSFPAWLRTWFMLETTFYSLCSSGRVCSSFLSRSYPIMELTTILSSTLGCDEVK